MRISQKWMSSAVLALTLAMGAPVQAESFSGSYLAARQASLESDFRSAAEYYTMAILRDPGNNRMLEPAALTFLALGDIDRALPIAQKIQAEGLQSQIAAMVIVGDQVRRAAFDEVLSQANGDTGIGPLVDGLLAAWAQMGLGKTKEALAAFDAATQQRGMQSFGLYHKALALALVGDFESADAIFSGNEIGPMAMTRRGAIARFQILSQLGRSQDAVALMDELFGPDTDPALAAMRVDLAAGKSVPFDTVAGAQDGMAEVFYSIGAALSNDAENTYTLLYSRLAEATRPDFVEAVLLSASMLEQLSQFDLSVEAYQKVPVDNAAFHAAELGRAEALRRSDKLQAGEEVLRSLAKSHGDLPVVHVTLGDLMRQLEKYADAAAAYDTALSKYDAPDPSQWFIYYARAIAFERQDKWEQAEADFRTALELSPEQPQVLNYLGYSLVEKGIKLEEALSMIERAAAARPDSGYIIDSLGWVLFRLGRYEEAVPHMERAAELMAVDPVVNDHLGDVLWAVGRKLEAQFQWRRALSFVDLEDASGEVDGDRIRRKLEVGLDAVLEEEGAPPLRVGNGSN